MNKTIEIKKDNELLIRTLILDGIFDKRKNKKHLPEELLEEVDEIYKLFIKIYDKIK